MNSQFKYFLGLWIINPFLSTLYLLKRFKSINSIWPYLLISFFFGLSFVISTDSVADSVRYTENLKLYYKNQTTLKSVLNSLYQEEGSLLDVYQPVLTWIVSRFTENYKILFAFFALIFGYFWFRTLTIIRNLLPDKLSVFILISFIFLALLNPIWNINGVRMWTAVQIFIYGVTRIYFLQDKKGVIFIVVPIFVHFSLIIALLLYLFFLVLPKKSINFFFALYFITFFIQEIDLEIVRNLFKNLPGFLESKKSYLNEDYKQVVEKKSELYAIHIVLYKSIVKNIIPTIILLLYLTYRKTNAISFNIKRLLIFGLFFASFANLASSVPSGGRFLMISNIILVAIFIQTKVNSKKSDFNKLVLILIASAMFFCILIQIRKMFDYVGILFFLGNPLISFFSNNEVPIIDFIKKLF